MSRKSIVACRHILTRVKQDSNFAWHMANTESLRLVVDAVADDSEFNCEKLRKLTDERIQELLKNEPAELPELRKRVEELEKELAALRGEDDSVGEVPEDSFGTRACNSIEELLQFCRIRGVSPTVEAVEAALNAKPLHTSLQEMP